MKVELQQDHEARFWVYTPARHPHTNRPVWGVRVGEDFYRAKRFTEVVPVGPFQSELQSMLENLRARNLNPDKIFQGRRVWLEVNTTGWVEKITVELS